MAEAKDGDTLQNDVPDRQYEKTTMARWLKLTGNLFVVFGLFYMLQVVYAINKGLAGTGRLYYVMIIISTILPLSTIFSGIGLRMGRKLGRTAAIIISIIYGAMGIVNPLFLVFPAWVLYYLI